ncbi:chaperone protein DNAj, putative [Trypanosoma brucei gambiense DAL972]|uniref:Chaperone protein DNAJ, putative n=3 Tax=Trypanosoma brucei TaxID=5691 RepID=Q57VJ1_TRYB2|nr:chaperone protein DNAj, putative [Trypanosoma brucei gambiense DAL972]XP_846243.1 chaperone protein DNAJ, putative [Trypanosoma brucei brucei TREU927]AAX70378.1 chaperone protein DNAJ, putative [Trypanosoma brucei]RHW71703.1 chaperone protein DNAj [Trypanosoma brucei equiperdum]AAZ12684.1 chaperone protein DNAJ, putative [Trypanosoma brucei brucei TREU927]CBH12827.1 chaperone protein DNAj, putative [Trypanosoma brucei gambiense DAL972]|eukprot:XP_011775106.1 chaperone protein DNAj, putative [Trypanosoma brucei gambiense DAL972]
MKPIPVAMNRSVRRAALMTLQPLVCSGTSARCITTGENHSFRPGRVTLFLRSLFVALTPQRLRSRMATGMQRGMERVQILEQEQLWLQRHGSPLRILGLPDHAELPEVRARYRELVLETHPDSQQRVEAVSGNGTERYDMIQTAYAMATNPTSLWHQNGAAPTLRRGLASGNSASLHVTLFAVMSYVMMGLVAVIFSLVVVRHLLEGALRLLDPKFYAFMTQQEEEERRRQLAGEVVDTDPKRLAPTVVKRLLFPGRFVHGGGSGDDFGYNNISESTGGNSPAD